MYLDDDECAGAADICGSGECVNIFQRCDNNQDCLDGSDEKDCNTIRIPGSYQVSAPPELSRKTMQANPIFTQIDILNIDFIDTVRMSAGLTIEVQMTWRDHKLVFENILPAAGKVDSFKVIAEKEFKKIWLPLPDIIHENARSEELLKLYHCRLYQFEMTE